MIPEVAFVEALWPEIEASQRPLDYEPVVDWMVREFYIPELKAPIVLYPHQIAALNEALRVDENGLFVYDLVLWSDIKKSAKSTIAGGVVLWRAVHTERGRFRIVANDLKQAASRVYDAIVACLDLNKRLGAQFDRTKYKLTHIPTGSTIEAVPVDPAGEAGGGDDMVEFTELHSAQHDAARRMWTETTLSPLKFGKSQRWIDSYAGWSGESPILEPLYQLLVTPENRISDEYQMYAVGRSFCLWNTEPRCPWQTPAYYASEETVLLPNEYRRVHKNEWVSSTQSFIPIEWWDACKVAELPPIDRYREIMVALDAAVSNDCFAMVAMSRTGDKTVVRYARVWKPDGSVIIYSNPADPTDRAYPEGELRWLINEFNVVCVTYDIYQLHSFCTGLAGEGLAAFEPFSQGDARLRADKGLYDHIRERRIVHDGNPDMREHLQNANSTAEERDTLRIVKRAAHLKIDLAVAASMCDDRARHWLAE